LHQAGFKGAGDCIALIERSDFLDAAVAHQVKFSNEWARENRDMMFGKAVAGIVTAMQDYADHKVEKGEPVPEMLTAPITRVRP
jgi:hypothetical protein